MLLFLNNSSSIYITKIKYNKLRKIIKLFVITCINNILVKKSAIASAIFLQVLYKTSFDKKDRKIITCINIMTFVKFCIFDRLNY